MLGEMDPTLQSLVLHRPLSLRVLHPGLSLRQDISWVANSDLADPRPFLSPGQVLLTTGRQFADWTGQQPFDEYVANLAADGIVGIGFGTEIFVTGTPPELITACQTADMSLIEVPYDTPFIAIIRWISDAIASKAKARAEWGRNAQSSISLTVIKGNGVDGVLAELARQLTARVCIIEANGRLAKSFGGSPTAAGKEATQDRTPVQNLAQALMAEATRLLGNKRRAGSSLSTDGTESVFQTLGEQNAMFGVLSVSGPDRFDRAAMAVITTAVALCEISFRDDAERATERMTAQSGVLAMLLEGHYDAAREFPPLGDSWLPRTPTLCFAVIGGGANRSNSVEAALRETPAMARIERLVACHDDDLVLVFANTHRRQVANFLAQGGMRAGLSGAVPPHKARQGLDQAVMALSSARDDVAVVDWGDANIKGFWELLDREELADYATLRLAALKDRPDGDELITFARAWFAHNCNGDAAAKEVGLHRHVLRNRLELIESTLGLTLSTFEGRAELWALLSTAP
ncbi:PucR family transcriptional regulator [Alpinimonas psychrophila]